MEIGALTVMTCGFRDRELILDLFEMITGLRMNHAFFRPGGVAQDMPAGGIEKLRSTVRLLKKRLPEYAALCNANPIFKGRLKGVGHLELAGCLALGLTGPILRATGYDWDLRRKQPYWGYETYDFDVVTRDEPDAYGRFRVRLDEMWESLKIVEQATERLAAMEGQPVMVADKKIAWPSQLSVGVRRPGQLRRAHQAHHGRVDGSADPPLQDRDRGLPRAGRPGVRERRGAARRDRLPPRLRRRHPALSRALPRSVVRQPAGHVGHERGRHAVRRHRRDRQHRPRDGGVDR